MAVNKNFFTPLLALADSRNDNFTETIFDQRFFIYTYFVYLQFYEGLKV